MTTNLIECKNINVSYDLHSHKISTLKEYLILKSKRGLSKTSKIALNNVNFEAKAGECVALIGHNGCGKSTLLKCIAGILQPNTGTIKTFGRIAPMIELGAGFDSEMTGRENVYLSCSLLGLVKSEIDAKIEEIEKFSELSEFFDAPVKTYSSGMYMRLGFACTTAISAEIVLIDEILAVGDENFQKKCLARIKNIRKNGSTVVLVSHDLKTVLGMADRAYVMDKGSVVFQGETAKSIFYYHKLMDEKRFAALSPAEQDEEFRQMKLLESADLSKYGVGAKVKEVKLSYSTHTNGMTEFSIKLFIDIFTEFEKNVVVGLALNSTTGTRVFGTNTKVFPPEENFVLRNPGQYSVEFKFKDVPLASGEYDLIVAIHDNQLMHTIDIQSNLSKFKITNEFDSFNFDKDIINPQAIISEVVLRKEKVAE